MTDRFKFRVWGKVFNWYWTDEEIKKNVAWLLFPDNDNINNVEIEQCTGLKDKNGTLVFEGDILQDGEQRIRVVFDEQRYCFMFEYQNTRAYKPISCIDVLDSELEVIGNIHKNEELLK